jgi:fumarate reductase subunit D
MKRSNEPLWWMPFSAGLMADALIMPALIVVTGIMVPFGVLPVDKLGGLLQNPIIRIGLFILISLTFFHAAHRLRYAIPDMGLRPLKPLMPFLCYGGAIVGTVFAALITFGVI